MTFYDSTYSSYKCTKCGKKYEDRELRAKISQNERMSLFNNTSGVIMHNACEDHIVDPKYIKRDMNPDAPDPYEIAMNVARNEFDQINRSIK